MAVYGYTKNYKLIKPQFDTDTWHDYEYDNLDTIDAVLSAIFASGDWQGFWKTNTHYDAGGVVIDRVTDTMYKIMVEHTTSEATFAEEFAAHPTYYELWSPNNLAEDWAIKMDGVVSNVDYSSKAYAISSALIDTGSAKEWAIKTDDSVGTTGEYSAKKHATDAASSASTATSQASAASASATLSQKWAVDANLVASTDYSSKSWATGSLDAGSAKDWAIKEGGQVGTTGKYSAKVYSLAAQNHYEKAVDWASKTNGLVEGTDYSAKAYAISEGLISAGSAKEWSNKAKAWATSSTIVEDGKYGASYYALQAYNANVTAQIAKTTAQEWASKTDAQVASTDYSSKAYAQSEGLISSGSSKEWATKSSTWAEGSDANVAVLGGTHSSKGWSDNAEIWAEGTDEQVQALGGVHSSKVWAEQSTNANIALTNSPYTTNRILEIPQDIKLELNSGTLTLKAGSKVYVPNGFESDGTTLKFDVITIENDLTPAIVVPNNNDFMWLSVQNGQVFNCNEITAFSSGLASNRPSTGIYYETDTNVFYFNNSIHKMSFPFGIVTGGSSTPTVTSIDQVFNGFGYVGGNIFALPGVKVQTPNGKNEDGTYKTIIRTIDSVKTFNAGAWTSRNLYIFLSGSSSAPIFEAQAIERFTYNKKFSSDTSTYSYDENTNKWWYSPNQTSWISFYGNVLGSLTVASGQITVFNPITVVDSVANSNASNFSQAGKSFLSALPAPTSSYTEYTVGASGANYVATDTGWAYAYGSATGNQTTSEYLQIIKGSFSEIECASKAINMTVCMYVKKGDTFTVNYKLNNGVSTAGYVRLYKAEGEI